MKKSFLLIVPALFILFLAAGCLGPKNAENMKVMTVSFEWDGHGGSSSSPNPEIHISNIPDGTAFFEVFVKDLQRLDVDHGGGTVAHDGSGKIAVGALKRYGGPQPPRGEVHTYVFRVRALNADKSLVLGEGVFARKYPEK